MPHTLTQRLAIRLLASALIIGLNACGGSSEESTVGSILPDPAPATQHALRFFGTGLADIDRVKIPISSSTQVNVGATDFTIEFWLKGQLADNAAAANCTSGPDAWRQGNIVIDRDTLGDGDFGDFGLSLFNGRVAFGVARGATGATICGNLNVLDGAWHHIAVTRRRSDGKMQLFVDGSLDAQLIASTQTSLDVSYNTARSTTVPNSDPFLVLGAEKHDASAAFPSFAGQLDELRISDNLRYLGLFARPIAPFVADGHTMALYHFDEGTGVDVSDAAAGATSPGTLQVGGPSNGPQWITDTPFS